MKLYLGPMFAVLIALMLPGAVSSLPHGYLIGGALSALTLLFLLFVVADWMRRGTMPVFSGLTPGLKTLTFVLAILYGIAAARAEMQGTDVVKVGVAHMLSIDLLSATAAFVAVASLRRKGAGQLLANAGVALAFALMVFILIELLLISLGIHNRALDAAPQTQYEALLLSLIGIHINRIMLPISSSVVNGAVIPLAGLILSVTFLRTTRYKRWANFCLTPASAILLALNDTRSFIFAAGAVLLGYGLIRRHRAKFAFATLIAPIIPPLIVVCAAFLPAAITELVSARYDAFGMFSGRQFIWGVAAAKWMGASLDMQIFGGGLYGQSLLGITDAYSQLFTGFTEISAELASLHNSYLQALADVGALGILVFAAFLYRFSRQLAVLGDRGDGGSNAASSMLALVIALSIVGGTEVILSPYFRETFGIMIFLFFALAMSPSFRGEKSSAIQG